MNMDFRSPEERALLNPSFCAVLLWHAAGAHSSSSGETLRFETAFLVPPLVLHRETREALPNAVTTPLAAWLEGHPLARSRVPELARTLVPFTKEALTFGGAHGFLDLRAGRVATTPGWKNKVAAILRASGAEVRECARRSEFVGRWFARTGDASTVMALMGVRP